jgi:feruloyl esterase
MTTRQTLRFGALTASLLASTTMTACMRDGAPNGPRVASAGTPAAPCDTLASAALPGATITSAEAREAGAFTPTGGGGFGGGPMDLPAFCRVAATLSPSADSEIKMEVWLPTEWNGKFMMVGNGAWSGAVSYFAMAEPLNRGYAVASTDTGHEGGRGTFAFEHPERLVDFAWRAVHETAVTSQALTAAYYGRDADLSYWNGCSSGGKQGLKEAQNFPEDFDAMIVGAPANNWVRLVTASVNASRANIPQGGSPILGPAQFGLLNRAVLAQCDALDGVSDGEIADPRQCSFDAASLACAAGQDPAVCLTPAQAEVANAIYSPVRNPTTDELIFPGAPPGAEPLWVTFAMGPFLIGVDTFAVLFGNPDWSGYDLDLATDVAGAEAADPGIVATDPDLSAFEARGGKIIQYHGWTDSLIATENSINYYESVVADQGGLEETQDFHRLFLVPGMGHCAGAYAIDWIGELEAWVEGGVAPATVSGRRLPPGPAFGPPPANAPDLGSRPICAYPDIAVYDGSGSDSDPASFTCQAAERGARAGHAP